MNKVLLFVTMSLASLVSGVALAEHPGSRCNALDAGGNEILGTLVGPYLLNNTGQDLLVSCSNDPSNSPICSNVSCRRTAVSKVWIDSLSAVCSVCVTTVNNGISACYAMPAVGDNSGIGYHYYAAASTWGGATIQCTLPNGASLVAFGY